VTTAEIEASRLCWAGGCEHARSGFACEACIAAALLAAEQRGAEAQRRACAEHVTEQMYGAVGGVARHLVETTPLVAAPSPGEEPR
jgi:hypothetical protein